MRDSNLFVTAILLSSVVAPSLSVRAQAISARPVPPTRDPHTAGFVTATELADGVLPQPGEDGNFIIGPTHAPAPESLPQTGTPKGAISEFVLSSTDSRYYPGIARDPGKFGTPDPANPARLIVTTAIQRPTCDELPSTCPNSMFLAPRLP